MTLFDIVPASKLLVPIDLRREEELSDFLVELTASLDILLLGYWLVPDQSSPEQIRDQYRDEAEQTLQKLVDRFQLEKAALATRLAFTADVGKTIEEVANEENCDAILVPRPVDDISSILIPVREAVSFDRLQNFVADLVEDYHSEITFLFFADSDKHDEKELVIKGLKKVLGDRGVDEASIREEVIDADNVTGDILKRARGHDLIIMSRTAPKLLNKLMRSVDEKVARGALAPVIVVRHREED